MASSPLAAAVLQRVAVYNQAHPQKPIDPQAELAVAAQEGLGGGIGDQGTSFGPNQLHKGGAYPAFAPQAPAAAQQWATSAPGIDFALNAIGGVSGGLKGRQAVTNIVQRFERPADPSREIQAALAAYGSPQHAAPGLPPSLAPAASAPAAPGESLMQILNAGARSVGLPTLNVPAAPAPARAVAPLALAAQRPAPHPAAPAPSGPAQLADVPNLFDTRPGIQVDQRILPQVEQLAQQFGVQVNSGYRSPEHNASVGGAPNSDHLTGDAVDFTGTQQQLAKLYKYAQGRYAYVEPWSQTGGSHDHISFLRGGS